jgi:hypothetical protein
MAKTSNRNTCAPPPSFQQERLAGDLSMPELSGSTPDQYLRPTTQRHLP